MIGNTDVIARLSLRVNDELKAINQYIIHELIIRRWGYEILADAIEVRSREEMKHLEKLVSRILFLEGLPTLTDASGISVGTNVTEITTSDAALENQAILDYRDDISFARQVSDEGTAEILEEILADEEAHLADIETDSIQIQQIGEQNFLTTVTAPRPGNG